MESQNSENKKPRPEPAPETKEEVITGVKSNTLERGPRRVRDKGHLKFVTSQSCLICGRKPSHAHHLKDSQVRAMGRKVSDEFTVPLCAIHHRELHERGNEKAWWKQHKIEPMKVARQLWQASLGYEVH